MSSYLYKPECPYADTDGMVSREDYYQYLYMSKPDMRMYNGNEPVHLRFISDSMDSTRHMANGKYYTSKQKFRRATKAAGCVEIGNESLYKRKSYIKDDNPRRERREHIRQAIRDLKDNKIPEGERRMIEDHSKKVDWVNRNRTRKVSQ